MTRARSFVRPFPLPVSTADAPPTAARADVLALFERLFADYQTPILNYLYRLLGDLALAEDLTQETFTRAWKARVRLPALENPRAWLYRIATNAARDHHRRARLLAWWPLLGREPALEAEDPADSAIESEAMRRALLKLAPDYRVPLVLYTCQEFTVAEIAAALDLSVDAVKQRLVRARQQLREAYP
jgi:RNA polymerase sigma-70 factor (ECF subfamily)